MKTVWVAVLAVVLVPLSARANDWHYTLSPYLWGAGLKGETRQLGLPEVETDLSFGDILDHLDFGLMVAGEARRDRFSWWGDLVYVNVSADKATVQSPEADRVDARSRTLTATLGMGYAVLDDGRTVVDALGGVRFWRAKSELGFTGGTLDGVRATDSATWADLMVGMRVQHALTERTYVGGWLLAGGGGAQFGWDAELHLGYRFSDSMAGVIGYRALGVDYDDSGFALDIRQNGPVAGLVFRF